MQSRPRRKSRSPAPKATVDRAAQPSLSGPVSWWKPSGVSEWAEEKDAAGRYWSIVELLNSGELRQEGDTMRHCVGHYDRRCQSGGTSIWSVRCLGLEAAYPVPILTIEMRNTGREIVQARGKCNLNAMSPNAGSLLRAAARRVIAWAKRENLAIAWGLLGWNRSQLLSEPDTDD